MTTKDESERERAAQLRQCRFHRVLGRGALDEICADEMRDNFRVGFGGKRPTLLLEALPQLTEILDDAIVNHRHVVGGMRMGVALGRFAVGGPARVSDSGMAVERRLS